MRDLEEYTAVDEISLLYIRYPVHINSDGVEIHIPAQDDYDISNIVLDAVQYCLSNLPQHLLERLINKVDTLNIKEYFELYYIDAYMHEGYDKEKFYDRLIKFVDKKRKSEKVDYADYESVCRVFTRWFLETLTFMGRVKIVQGFYAHNSLFCYYDDNYNLLLVGEENDTIPITSLLEYYTSGTNDLRCGNNIIHEVVHSRLLSMRPIVHESGFLCIELSKYFNNTFDLAIILETFRQLDSCILHKYGEVDDTGAVLKQIDANADVMLTINLENEDLRFANRYSEQFDGRGIIFNSDKVQKFKDSLSETLSYFFRSISPRYGDELFFNTYSSYSPTEIIFLALMCRGVDVYVDTYGFPYIEFAGNFIHEWNFDFSNACIEYKRLFISVGVVHLLNMIFSAEFNKQHGWLKLRKYLSDKINNGGLDVDDFGVRIRDKKISVIVNQRGLDEK